jgi:hypothetical protein
MIEGLPDGIVQCQLQKSSYTAFGLEPSGPSLPFQDTQQCATGRPSPLLGQTISSFISYEGGGGSPGYSDRAPRSAFPFRLGHEDLPGSHGALFRNWRIVKKSLVGAECVAHFRTPQTIANNVRILASKSVADH